MEYKFDLNLRALNEIKNRTKKNRDKSQCWKNRLLNY